MCGIFGLVAVDERRLTREAIRQLAHQLLRFSERRGSEAAGMAVRTGARLDYYKTAAAGRRMWRQEEFQAFLTAALGTPGPVALLGHSRLVTNGTQGIDRNNQPIESSRLVGVHNGIVVNDAEIWHGHPELVREREVDTEVIYKLLDHAHTGTGTLADAVRQVYRTIVGEANIAFLGAHVGALGLATNVGSLYLLEAPALGLTAFASERSFLTRLAGSVRALRALPATAVTQLAPGEAAFVALEDAAVTRFALATDTPVAPPPVNAPVPILERSRRQRTLRRCSRCILPHTFPFITFDQDGVCNFCRDYRPLVLPSREDLERTLAPHRRTDGAPDCIVALSGGRDSCYGLHVIKRELGLNPIAYTYDWAMVTDEARRNCSRICAALEVEHIIRSADILTKRRNIKLNIEAWLRRPDLGMIPLFMAGDKQFFHYATEVSKETGVPLIIFCGGNNLEVTHFKTGFCGVEDRSTGTMVGLDTRGKIQLALYYARQFLLNPAYLNRSLIDTAFAYYATYVARGEFLYLYQHVAWDEQRMHDTLSREYGWESAGDSATSWRIGDGTASFYNYIYHTVAGFTEHDTFRSNQVRAGLVSRDEALRMVELDNQPRYESMREYAQLVGFNLDSALTVINAIPKLT